MKRPGQIVPTPFPHTDLSSAKLRPVLMLRQDGKFLKGAIGTIDDVRLTRIRRKLADWVVG